MSPLRRCLPALVLASLSVALSVGVTSAAASDPFPIQGVATLSSTHFTVLWDRVFGTYLDPTWSKYQNHLLGLPYDQDFVGALTAGRVKLPATLRRRFQVERFCNLQSPVSEQRADDGSSSIAPTTSEAVR